VDPRDESGSYFDKWNKTMLEIREYLDATESDIKWLEGRTIKTGSTYGKISVSLHRTRLYCI
jgi:hypothetical protein